MGALGKKYEKILSRIEKLNLYDTLNEITKEEELKLIEGFGDLWMLKFFNIYTKIFLKSIIFIIWN